MCARDADKLARAATDLPEVRSSHDHVLLQAFITRLTTASFDRMVSIF
jgi:hypothetical protein